MSFSDSLASSRYLCGDLVIHPTRPWPWLGTVHPKLRNNCRLCSNCGEIQTFDEFNPTSGKTETVCENCGEEPEQMNAVECCNLSPNFVKAGNPNPQSNLNDFPELLEAPSKLDAPVSVPSSSYFSAAELTETEKSTNKLWHATWFPLGEVAELDGSEVVILPFKMRSMFQEGSPVSRKDNSAVGLVKQVHRKLDVFVLPDYNSVICDLSSERLQPVSFMEQSPGCYVIHKGWVGAIFNVFNKVYFRNKDGAEFYVTDEENEHVSVHVSEIDKKSNYENSQFYPGQAVKLRLCLLEKAVWLNGKQEIDGELKEKIDKSRLDYTTGKDALRRQSDDDFDPSSRWKSLGNFVSSTYNGIHSAACDAKSLNYIQKCVTALEACYGSDNNNAKQHGANSNVFEEDDCVFATVIKIEPVKIEIEWISRVVPDPALTETSMKANYIEGDDLKNITTFRACRAYESFDLGARYMCCLNENDRQMSREKWRQKMLNLCDENEKPDFSGEKPDDELIPVTESVAYVTVARSSTKIDVLWEDGVFESNLDLCDLSAQYSHPVDRDYFPAMYVLLQGASASSNPEMKISLPNQPGSENAKNIEDYINKSLSNNLSRSESNPGVCANSRYKNVLPNKFGVVRKSRNSEKFATVDWYDFDPVQYQNSVNDNDAQPKFIKTEDVSFYDLKFYHDYNYVGGTLVSLVKPESPSIPNVGYIRRKNPDGTVLVIWYNGREETTFPWRLKQMNNRMLFSEYSASDAENDHYYSPTEHEYEDLEDFRYYDYTSLSENQRNKRVALIVTLLQEVIPRLVRAISIAFKYFSTLDRKKFVKLTLSANDVTNGFAQMPDFRECLKDVYEFEHELTKLQKCQRKNSFREEKLIWQCANWLYDWTDVMSTLHEDIRKERDRARCLTTIKTQLSSESGFTKSEAKRSKIEPPSITDPCISENCNSAAGETDSSKCLPFEDPMEMEDPLATEMLDLLRSIETGLSTITGILAVPSSSDITPCVILEYINNCRKKNSANPPAMDNNNVQYANLTLSHTFLLQLVSNSGKTSRLPCFAFAHRSDQDLIDLEPKWNVQSIKSCRLKRDDAEKKLGDDSVVSPQAIVEHVSSLVETVLEGKKVLSCKDDDILDVCNEIADGLCLSVLSILNAIVNRVGSHLSSSVAKLFETANIDDEKAVENAQIAQSSEDYDISASCSSSAAEEVHPVVSTAHQGCFEVLPIAPSSHRFVTKTLNGQNVPKSFFSAVRREIKLLQSSLPPGIFVKTYEDRMDLFSCMIVGPQGTPYADGLFFFDVRLREDYPNRPPHAFFKSMSKLLNPNLYEDGMVCLSLLGTWEGKEVELWSPSSNLLQVFVSIQSLILVSEPYFNEPGYEKEKGTATGPSKSRDYNESAVLRTLESLKRVVGSPPEPFLKEILQHIKENGPRLIKLLDIYQNTEHDNSILSFPLFPVTQGFCLCIKRHSATLLNAMQNFIAQYDSVEKSENSRTVTNALAES